MVWRCDGRMVAFTHSQTAAISRAPLLSGSRSWIASPSADAYGCPTSCVIEVGQVGIWNVVSAARAKVSACAFGGLLFRIIPAGLERLDTMDATAPTCSRSSG